MSQKMTTDQGLLSAERLEEVNQWLSTMGRPQVDDADLRNNAKWDQSQAIGVLSGRFHPDFVGESYPGMRGDDLI